MVEVMITMAYRPLGYASFSTMMMTFQHIPKPLPKQEQPSVFPTSFSILGGVGWLQLAPPNLRSINLQIRIQKKKCFTTPASTSCHHVEASCHPSIWGEVTIRWKEAGDCNTKTFPFVRFFMSDFFQMYAFHPDLSCPSFFVRHFPMRKQRHEVT